MCAIALGRSPTPSIVSAFFAAGVAVAAFVSAGSRAKRPSGCSGASSVISSTAATTAATAPIAPSIHPTHHRRLVAGPIDAPVAGSWSGRAVRVGASAAMPGSVGAEPGAAAPRATTRSGSVGTVPAAAACAARPRSPADG